jgi:hypothetical protein
MCVSFVNDLSDYQLKLLNPSCIALYLLLPPEGVRVLLPPDDVRDEPPELVVPEPELLGAGELDTAGLLLLPPDEGVTALPGGAVRAAGVARGTDELPELPDRLSGRL